MESDIYKTPESELEVNSNKIKRKLSPKTLFKLIFVGYFFGMGSLLFLDGIFSLILGTESFVTFNGEKLSGAEGFFGNLIFIPISSLLVSFFNWLILLLGLWLYGLLKGPVTLEFKG